MTENKLYGISGPLRGISYNPYFLDSEIEYGILSMQHTVSSYTERMFQYGPYNMGHIIWVKYSMTYE